MHNVYQYPMKGTRGPFEFEISQTCSNICKEQNFASRCSWNKCIEAFLLFYSIELEVKLILVQFNLWNFDPTKSKKTQTYLISTPLLHVRQVYKKVVEWKICTFSKPNKDRK